MKKKTSRFPQIIDRKIQGLLAFSLLTFVLLAGLIYQQKESQQARRSWVDHTNQAIKKISSISILISEAETINRSAASTNNSVWEKESTNIHQQLGKHIADLILFTADNPLQQENIKKLQKLIGQKELFGNDASNKGDPSTVTALSVKKVLEDMLQEEDELLAKRVEQSEYSYRTGIYIA